MDVMDEVSGRMKSDETARRASIARGFSCHSMAFPSSGGEVLHGVVETTCLQVGFLKHQDGVSLCPNPILYFPAKEGDIAEEQLQNLLRLLGFLCQSFSNLDGRVRNQFSRAGED